MIVKRTILGILFLLLLAGCASAIDMSSSTISTDTPGWMVANGLDQATITVHVSDGVTSVQNANVTFDFGSGSAGLGTLTPAAPIKVITGADGLAHAVFHTGTRSGNATINATISLDDGFTAPVSLLVFQRIDHDIPQDAHFTYPAQATVGSIVPLNITITDISPDHNPVDNKNLPETITLTISAAGGAGFWDGTGYVPQIVQTPDANGTVSVNVRISTIALKNYIQMDPIGNMVLAPQIFINGVADSNPAYISQSYPTPNVLPADGTSSFSFFYNITDKYDNPISGTSVFINSTDGLSTTQPSNGEGIVSIYYSKTVTGTYTVSAFPVNTSALCKDTGTIGYCAQDVQFYNTDPVDMEISASPLAMVSHDVDVTSKSTVQARVTDIMGNPVTGEQVFFSLGAPSYWGAFNVTGAPTLSAFTANTVAGVASVTFTPGSFAWYGSPGYNQTATGTIPVTARWQDPTGNNITRTIILQWQNYPYLSTSATASPSAAIVGQPINITITITGDGAALRPKPVDAELVMDVSGSMGSTMGGPNGTQTKLYYSKSAGRTFVNKMDSTKDQIGLTTFDSYNSAYTTNVYHLGNNFIQVKNSIAGMTTHSNTATRDGLKLGIDDVIARRNLNPNSIQAVILMTDGAYNDDGDPLARATGVYKKTSHFSGSDGDKNWYNFSMLSVANQNLARYASQNNIRVYTVTFGTDAQIQQNYVNTSSQWQIYNTMDLIASQTGGTHYHATDGSQLVDVYTAIAGQLQETAGGNTQLNLGFNWVDINNQPSQNITQYLNYTYDNPTPANPKMLETSTFIGRNNKTPAGIVSWSLPNITRDDTAAWQAKSMVFNVGTIKLNDTWVTTFRLVFRQPVSKIELFGPNTSTTVTFTDASTGASSSVPIPPVQASALPAGGNNPFGGFTLSLDNMTPAGFPGSYDPTTNHAKVRWNTTYNGNMSVTEFVQWKKDNDLSAHFAVAPGGMISMNKVTEFTSYYELDASDDLIFPPGNDFSMVVNGTAFDSNGASTSPFTFRKPGPTSAHYIKLE